MKVYLYFASTGLESRAVIHKTKTSVTVSTGGLASELVALQDLDVGVAASGRGSRYYTTPERAIRAFIDHGEERLANPSVKLRPCDRKAWRAEIAKAKALLPGSRIEAPNNDG